jgi:hypothetical protein
MTLASTTRRHCADPAGAAQQVAAAVAPLFRGPLPVGIRAWDGSAAGQRDAPAVVLNDPAALRRLLFRCGELGLAQAYVSGEIDVDGDLLEGLRAVWRSERAGLEVRDVHALREHYVRTVEAWYATFEERWDEVVAMVGEEVARVWRLYLVGGALAFEEGRMGVDQILVVKPGPAGRSGLPLVRDL